MPSHGQKRASMENRLLAALPAEDYKSLLPHLKSIHLAPGQVLFEPFVRFSYCYFPTDALVSMMSDTEQGGSVAVGMVGREGLLGGVALLEDNLHPYRVVSICSGNAMRMRTDTLKSWAQNHHGLRPLILLYAHALFTQVVQTATCNRFHLTEQRLARWLLLARDRLEMTTLPFTQESLSQMLGTDRVTVTRAVQRLKKTGLIDYSRGKITLLDQKKLESASCECYGMIKSAYDSMLSR